MSEQITGGSALKENQTEIRFPVSLRDYFAAQAMNGICSRVNATNLTDLADWSYKISDAMLKERAKQ